MTAVTVKLEDQDKRELDELCAQMGMSVTTFFTIYAKKAIRERRIPFEINAPDDPFYSESNMQALEESKQQYNNGRVVVKSMDALEAMANA